MCLPRAGVCEFTNYMAQLNTVFLHCQGARTDCLSKQMAFTKHFLAYDMYMQVITLSGYTLVRAVQLVCQCSQLGNSKGRSYACCLTRFMVSPKTCLLCALQMQCTVSMA